MNFIHFYTQLEKNYNEGQKADFTFAGFNKIIHSLLSLQIILSINTVASLEI